MRFEVSGQAYEIDLSPEKFMGDELLLVDDHLSAGWAHRWATLDLGVRDIVVMTYLAAKRAGELRPFDEFVKTIAPLTFQPLPDVQPSSTDKLRAKAATATPEGALGPMVRGRKAKPKQPEDPATSAS